VIKMFDTRELVNFTAHSDAEGRERRQRNGMISQRDMSDFIENLIPGKSCMSSLEMPHRPLSRSLEVWFHQASEWFNNPGEGKFCP